MRLPGVCSLANTVVVGLIVGAVVSQAIDARGQSIATKVPARFRTFTIVEQVRKATLYTP